MRAAFIVLRGAQIAQRLVGQILFEVVLRLLDQRGAVRQKKHVGYMAAPAQHIGQAGCGAGLARASSHDQQIAPEALRDVGADSPDGVFLIVAVGDFIINFRWCPAAFFSVRRFISFCKSSLQNTPLTARCGPLCSSQK